MDFNIIDLVFNISILFYALIILKSPQASDCQRGQWYQEDLKYLGKEEIL